MSKNKVRKRIFEIRRKKKGKKRKKRPQILSNVQSWSFTNTKAYRLHVKKKKNAKWEDQQSKKCYNVVNVCSQGWGWGWSRFNLICILELKQESCECLKKWMLFAFVFFFPFSISFLSKDSKYKMTTYQWHVSLRTEVDSFFFFF